MAALPFVSGDMLRRGTNRLAGKLGKSSLVNAMAPRRIEIDRAHMLQAFDQAWHRDKHCCFWHLAQPREPALTGFRTMLCQCIELLRERGMAACEARSDMQEDKHQGRFGGRERRATSVAGPTWRTTSGPIEDAVYPRCPRAEILPPN